MTRFITDIPCQTACIDGVCYTYSQLTASYNRKYSELQQTFYARYGENSFKASLADFLTEWFNDKDYVCVHTSGSTGTPKEMWVEKQKMMNSACLTASFLGLQQGESAHLCMPLKYIAGKMVVIRALVAQLNLIVTTPDGHPMKHLSLSPTFSAMIPMQVFNSLQVEAEKIKLQQIRHLIIGGGSIDEHIEQTLQTFPHAVWSSYGMTETLSHIALRRLNGEQASMWYTPFDSVRLSLSAEQTLIIDAPMLNQEILITNDIVEFNNKGQFKVIGRKDNIINTGGIKVQTEQVEQKLKEKLKIHFMITAIPDAKFGERIVMLIENSKETANSCLPPDVKAAIASLHPYCQPKTVWTVSHLPLTETGKPDRAEAKKLALKLAEKI